MEQYDEDKIEGREETAKDLYIYVLQKKKNKLYVIREQKIDFPFSLCFH